MSTPHAMNKLIALVFYASVALTCLGSNPTFTVDASRPAGQVSPTLYALMTEEITHSYDGGFYAQLIRNRPFLDSANAPAYWAVVNDDDAAADIALDPTNSFNDQLTMNLRMTVTKATKDHPAGVANSGYWG